PVAVRLPPDPGGGPAGGPGGQAGRHPPQQHRGGAAGGEAVAADPGVAGGAAQRGGDRGPAGPVTGWQLVPPGPGTAWATPEGLPRPGGGVPFARPAFRDGFCPVGGLRGGNAGHQPAGSCSGGGALSGWRPAVRGGSPVWLEAPSGSGPCLAGCADPVAVGPGGVPGAVPASVGPEPAGACTDRVGAGGSSSPDSWMMPALLRALAMMARMGPTRMPYTPKATMPT